MIPLFSSEQLRAADNYAIKKLGIPGIVLMENASLSIFHSILEYIPDLNFNDTVGIVAGKGNNGGDGFALARQFVNAGIPVHVISMGKEKELKGDALTNYRIYKNLIAANNYTSLTTFSTVRDLNKLSSCLIIVDAILGTGSKGELRYPYTSIINKLNNFDSIRVAIDIPTGLDLDTGYTELCFDADLTISLAELKRGLFYNKGYAFSGEVVKGSIGLGSEYFDSITVNEYLVEPEDANDGLPVKQIDAHKYSAGKVLTIAGSGSLPGAAFFTANSVLKSGGGASVLAFPRSLKQLAQQKLDGATVISYDDKSNEILSEGAVSSLTEKIKWADVIAIGPGLGREVSTQKAVLDILNNFNNKKFVIDADALYPLRNGKFKKVNLQNKILTPHHKEFADLLGIEIVDLQKNILEIGRKFASSTKSYLALKGAPTIIFNPAGEVFINTSGNEGMAKFGTGDVLTGVIAAMLSQSSDIESALISSVYLHGLSADLLLEKLTEYGITASDIMNNIPAAIKFLRNSIV
jgi:ADP-dependent NAD(P)H-hydrate dehydratase / NAD(P)H-hydrate epimerase